MQIHVKLIKFSETTENNLDNSLFFSLMLCRFIVDNNLIEE